MMSVTNNTQCFVLAAFMVMIVTVYNVKLTIAQINSELDVPQNPKYHELNTTQCRHILRRKTIKRIRRYREIAQEILYEVTKGEFRGRFYNNIAKFADKFGHRISGSEALEKSIDYMKDKFENAGLDDIEEQQVQVPKWVRGPENAEMIEPFQKPLNILSLGTSIGTPTDGITANVVVVASMEELKDIGLRGEVAGKIVLFNFNVTYYSEVTGIVKNAASNASVYGAKAALTKSITKVSINSPHTKLQTYANGITKIPVASVTLEDAELLGRLYKSGKNIVVKLVINILENTESYSRNLIGNLKGSKLPEKIVLTSGHIDSWDVGQGVQDDGIGVFLSYETIRLLQYMRLRPRRTVRAVLWTSEEFSSAPPEEYIKKYQKELKNHNVLMEADFGCYKPVGFYYSKLPEVGCILNEITKLIPQTNTTSFIPVDEIPNDLNEFLKHANIPTVSLNGNDGRYFWYHHTAGDTMSIVNPHDLDLCLAAWATTVFVLADMKEDLPR